MWKNGGEIISSKREDEIIEGKSNQSYRRQSRGTKIFFTAIFLGVKRGKMSLLGRSQRIRERLKRNSF